MLPIKYVHLSLQVPSTIEREQIHAILYDPQFLIFLSRDCRESTSYTTANIKLQPDIGHSTSVDESIENKLEEKKSDAEQRKCLSKSYLLLKQYFFIFLFCFNVNLLS